MARLRRLHCWIDRLIRLPPLAASLLPLVKVRRRPFIVGVRHDVGCGPLSCDCRRPRFQQCWRMQRAAWRSYTSSAVSCKASTVRLRIAWRADPPSWREGVYDPGSGEVRASRDRAGGATIATWDAPTSHTSDGDLVAVEGPSSTIAQPALGFSRTTATPWPDPTHTPTAP